MLLDIAGGFATGSLGTSFWEAQLGWRGGVPLLLKLWSMHIFIISAETQVFLLFLIQVFGSTASPGDSFSH